MNRNIEQLRKQMLSVLNKNPTLVPHGWRPWNVKDDGISLLDDYYLEQFSICKEWLSQVDRTKTISRKYGSYTLKHIVEYCTGKYVCNGAFIAAAIYLKISVKPIRSDSPNAFLAISVLSVRQLIKEAKKEPNSKQLGRKYIYP